MNNSKVGTFLNMPYDFRKPTLARLKQRWWNPKDKGIITPRFFGWGYAINLYQLFSKVGLIHL